MAEEPVVRVKEGQLRGKVAADHYNRPYYSFQGIPYAQPPLGKLRFKSPLPADSWTGIRDATAIGNDCFARHMIFQNVLGSEDCLFLNVYTPSLPSQSSRLLPVMVWIHGGAFVSGSGSCEIFSPDFLVPHDVVVVTINYRLGLLGFINFEDASLGVPGNAGLKDQVLALKWVKENIGVFNGNPDNVTIFGESAGGASVNYHILSPASKGLFKKAILQSGTALAVWALGSRSAPVLAKILNCESASEKEILKKVEEMSSEELLDLQTKMGDKICASCPRVMGPVIESLSSEDAFITKHPLDILKSGHFNNVPVIIGYCSREGMIVEMMSKVHPQFLKALHSADFNVPFEICDGPKESEAFQQITKKIKDFYFGGKEEATPGTDEFYVLQTDTFFVTNIFDTTKYLLANLGHPIYFYRLSVESDLNIFKKLSEIKRAGVSHADDLFYLFKGQYTPPFNPQSLEADSVHRLTKLWTSFARTGDPNPVEEDPLINVKWQPVEKGKVHYLDIGENLTTGINPDHKRMKFWEDIYKDALPDAKL